MLSNVECDVTISDSSDKLVPQPVSIKEEKINDIHTNSIEGAAQNNLTHVKEEHSNDDNGDYQEGTLNDENQINEAEDEEDTPQENNNEQHIEDTSQNGSEVVSSNKENSCEEPEVEDALPMLNSNAHGIEDNVMAKEDVANDCQIQHQGEQQSVHGQERVVTQKSVPNEPILQVNASHY